MYRYSGVGEEKEPNLSPPQLFDLRFMFRRENGRDPEILVRFPIGDDNISIGVT